MFPRTEYPNLFLNVSFQLNNILPVLHAHCWVPSWISRSLIMSLILTGCPILTYAATKLNLENSCIRIL